MGQLWYQILGPGFVPAFGDGTRSQNLEIEFFFDFFFAFFIFLGSGLVPKIGLGIGSAIGLGILEGLWSEYT